MENTEKDGTQENAPVEAPSGEGDATKSSDDGVSSQQSSEGPNAIEQARTENDRREKLQEDERKILDRKEKLLAEQLATGRGQTVQAKEKAPLTPEEYADAYQRGEVEPFTDP